MVHAARAFAASLLVLALSACPAPRATATASFAEDDEARAALDTARARLAAGEPVEAAQLFEDVATRWPRSAEADEALFGAGKAWEDAGQAMRARSAYQTLVRDHPESDKLDAAKVRLAALGESDKALSQAEDRWSSTPDADRYRVASELAARAEETGAGETALRWRQEALLRARTPPEKETAQNALVTLVDEKLSFIDVTRLAGSVDASSAAAPLLAAKLARIELHLRQYDKLQDQLESFLSHFPSDPFAAEARGILDRIKQREVVTPDRIGVVLPLSGKYKSFGESIRAGLQVALQGSSLQLVARDDSGEAQGAAAAVERLVFEDHVIGIVGGVLTAESDAAALKASELQVPFVGFSRSEGFTRISEWVFRDMLTNSEMVAALVHYAVDIRGMKKFAILHPQLPYGNDMRDLFWDAAEKAGAEIRGVESYAQDATNFSDPIRKLVGRYYLEERSEYLNRVGEMRAQGIDSARVRRNMLEKIRMSLTPVVDFDALFIPDQWKEVALVAPGLAFEDVITDFCDQSDVSRIERTAGHKVDPVMLLGANLWNHPDLPARAGKYVNCSVFVDGFWAGSARPEAARFTQAFSAANGRSPALLEAYGAEAATAIRTAMEKARPSSRSDLRKALAAIKDAPGPMGPTTTEDGREIRHPLFFLTVDKGAIREADPTKKDGPP